MVANFQSARFKFLMSTTCTMVRMLEPSVFWALEAAVSLIVVKLFQSARSNFFMSTPHVMVRKMEPSVFWA